MTGFEKHIYNTYLRVSRTLQNKPFKYREDWTGFETTDKFIYTHKLASFFGKFPYISLDFFFTAPYKVYPGEDDYYDLQFYTTPRAVKVYSMYIEKRRNENPDNPDQLGFIKDSLQFIRQFCEEKQITLDKYLRWKNSETDVLNCFISHLKENKVSIYTLFGFSNFELEFNRNPKDILEFVLGDNFYNAIGNYRAKYYSSSKCKKLVEKGIKIVETQLNSSQHHLT